MGFTSNLTLDERSPPCKHCGAARIPGFSRRLIQFKTFTVTFFRVR